MHQSLCEIDFSVILCIAFAGTKKRRPKHKCFGKKQIFRFFDCLLNFYENWLKNTKIKMFPDHFFHISYHFSIPKQPHILKIHPLFPTTFMFGSPFLRPCERHTQNNWKLNFAQALVHQNILLLSLLYPDLIKLYMLLAKKNVLLAKKNVLLAKKNVLLAKKNVLLAKKNVLSAKNKGPLW